MPALVPRRTEARLAAITARSTAALTAERCRSAAPHDEWLLATPLRIPPVPVGPPDRPLILGAAALATANSAVALALDFVVASGDGSATDLTLVTAQRIASAAREAIDALEAPSSSRGRQRLAHATAQATHAAADALASYALAASSRGLGRAPRSEYAFPRAWVGVVDALKMRLFGERSPGYEDEGDPQSMAAAEAAYDAAARALQVCALPYPRLGACAAEHRVTRAACLASTFVGWAALGRRT